VVTPSGGQLAGKYGTALLCLAAGELDGFNVLDTNWAIAEKSAAENGQIVERSRIRIVIGLHLADTVEKAKANLKFAARPFIDYVNNNFPRHNVGEGEDIVEWIIDKKVGIVGTPDQAIERIEEIQEKLGDFGTVLINGFPWADHHETIRSLELYADYVIPHFERQKAARKASYDWITTRQTGFAEQRVRAVEKAFTDAGLKGDVNNPHQQQL
jgi:limonene 1,2-monooxygenase